MPSDVLHRSIGIGLPLIAGFLLTLSRLSGLLVFLPVPMMTGAPELAKAGLALVLTIAMFPFWPKVAGPIDSSTILAWIAGEAALGIGMGLLISLAAEAMSVAMQMIASQAGYSYASSIDPNSSADSGVLTVLGQLMASCLFFAFGFDRQLIRILAASLQSLPPGGVGGMLQNTSPDMPIRIGATALSAGLRMALPIAGFLIVLDLALALLGRLNQQLQLVSVAFPAKMLLALTLLAVLAPVLTKIYQSQIAHALASMEQMVR